MCNVLEIVICRPKEMESCDSLHYEVHMGSFPVSLFEFSLGSFGAGYKISEVHIFKGYCSHSV